MAELISVGAFATEGERKAAEQLRQLPDSWLVICNKILPTTTGRSFEIDVIVVGKRWIFVLDEKSWQGKIRGTDEQWIRADGSSERSPLAKIDYVAKILAGHLGWKISALKNNGHFVRGGVLFSSLDQQPQIHDPRAAHGIFLLTDVCQRLQALDNQGGIPLVGQFSHLIKTALVGLVERPRVPKQINLFTIHDATSIRPGVRLCHASIEGNTTVSRLLMVYELGNNPLTAKEQREFYMQEFQALQKLHATGLVPKVDTPFVWSDDYLVLPIAPPQGKSLSAYPLPETRDEFVQDLMLAAAAFKGLDQIHTGGVLHRALGPEAIYVQSGQKLVFTNFYASRVGSDSIANTLDALSHEDPYASEDLEIGYGYASKLTDTFSLALVFLERLSGVSISTIRASVESSIIFPDRPSWSSFLPIELAEELVILFKQVLMPEKDAPVPSAKEIAARLGELANRLQHEVGSEGKRTLMSGKYRIHRLLGQGMMARTYLASYAAHEELGYHVLKQFLHPAEVYRQGIAEYRTLQNIKSKYFPTIEDILLPEDEAHIKMEYIPGPTLQQVEAEFPWPLERWWAFAQELLEAVDALEQKKILHRDIKPANIILHEDDNHPVLIDFGFAIQQGQAGRVAGSPLYLPPEALAAPQPPATSDRYALGVVLFKALTGYQPFTNGENGQRTLLSPQQFADVKVSRLATVLLRVVSPDPTERPLSIAQMRHDLQTAMLAVEEPPEESPFQEQINPWVSNIRGLYRNSETGNADNRGLDSDFVRETYVPTALDEELLPELFTRRPKVIFLSGNPGDGKTAFLEQVQQVLKDKGAQPVASRQNPSGWEWIYDGHTFRSCYDASEAYAGMSADEQLTEKLQGLEGHNKPNIALTVLVAINDGRLADYFSRNHARFPWLAKQLDQAHNGSSMQNLDVRVIDLKKRAFVNLLVSEEKSIFRRVLDRLIASEKWDVCDTCAARNICPIYANAMALRKPRVQQRLELLFLLTHMRYQRHITMRDLRSALAYLITANNSCEQIHIARHGEDNGSSLVDLSYWQSVFALQEDNDDLLRDINVFDPARFPQPHLDRFLHFHQSAKDAELRSETFTDHVDLPPQRFKREADWMAAYKRRLYFYAGKLNQKQTNSILPQVRWTDLLPYMHAILYAKLLDERVDTDKIRERLALGILRSDAITADVPPGKLSVVVRTSEEQQLIILKQIPLEEFHLLVQYPRNAHMIETLPEIAVLEHRSGTPRLEISLDLFELLMRMADGLQPGAPEYQPLLDDLKLFKDALLLLETRDLVLIENHHRIHHVTQKSGKVVRTALE